MALIFETEAFSVESREKPHLDREDGGHVTIFPKEKVCDRYDLDPERAIKLMRLTMVVGQAMTTVMNRNGVDIGRINYQDNGNWSVFRPEGAWLHIHLYGRAKSAKRQPYGQACVFPHIAEHPEFYADLKPLNDEDVRGMRFEIERLLQEERYLDENWGLS